MSEVRSPKKQLGSFSLDSSAAEEAKFFFGAVESKDFSSPSGATAAKELCE